MTREVLRTDVGEIEDVLLGAMKIARFYDSWEMRANLLFWAGRANDAGEDFFTKRVGKNVSLLVGESESSAKQAFTIGIGETVLYFDSRTAIPGRMVYKAKPLAELADETAEQVIFNFINVRPTLAEIIDIRPETLKQKMVAQKEKAKLEIPDFLLNSLRIRS